MNRPSGTAPVFNGALRSPEDLRLDESPLWDGALFNGALRPPEDLRPDESPLWDGACIQWRPKAT